MGDASVIILAHFIGNHLLNNDYIILNRASFKPVGWRVCLIHSFIYTATMLLFTQALNPIFLASVFLIHFAVDKFNLAEIWLELSGNRSLIKFTRNQKNNLRNKDNYMINIMNTGDMLNSGFSVANNILVNAMLNIVPLYFILNKIQH